MSQKVRVRFAPSPTGPLHIGGVRTALFNYLFAKKNGGDFILRIEDTDQTRFVSGAEEYIIEAMNWLGIPFDEGVDNKGDFSPYKQSERKHLYNEYAAQLIKEGKAYYAFDTAEELSEKRKAYEAEKKTFIYNWHNRASLNNSLALSDKETNEKIAAGTPYVIRFKTPTDTTLVLQDEIRGEIKIDTNTLDDKVLFKSDGMPTYHLANIVDDHLMEISHVIRGEEWLPSLALHQLLYDAFVWEAPKFAHLPLIMKPVGKGKLSKRDGAKFGFPVFPLLWNDEKSGETYAGYREDGYLPESVVNMLALLGWNPGNDEELFSLEELVESFDLNKVNKSGAKFDLDKTKWFQNHYLQQLDNEALAKKFTAVEPKLDGIDINYTALVVGLVKERATFAKDLWDLSSYFFEAPSQYDAKASKKAWKDGTADLMNQLITIVENIDPFDQETIKSEIKGWITGNEIGFGKVMQPLRLALVGALKGPDVFDIIFMVGKNETIKRIKNLIASLS